ncbi:hypothetical protein B0H11DRAFT_1914542 [Mycena galericulata]|nr:hypothetical protein B0H11DRAFT_1914542 [Mycena galericulata]
MPLGHVTLGIKVWNIFRDAPRQGSILPSTGSRSSEVSSSELTLTLIVYHRIEALLFAVLGNHPGNVRNISDFRVICGVFPGPGIDNSATGTAALQGNGASLGTGIHAAAEDLVAGAVSAGPATDIVPDAAQREDGDERPEEDGDERPKTTGTGKAKAAGRGTGKGEEEGGAGIDNAVADSFTDCVTRVVTLTFALSRTGTRPTWLPADRKLPEKVEAYVRSRATPERRTLMGEFRRGSMYEFDRSVAIVRNKLLMEELGLGSSRAGVFEEGTAEKGPSKPRRKTHVGSLPTRCSTRKRNGAGGESGDATTLGDMDQEQDARGEEIEITPAGAGEEEDANKEDVGKDDDMTLDRNKGADRENEGREKECQLEEEGGDEGENRSVIEQEQDGEEQEEVGQQQAKPTESLDTAGWPKWAVEGLAMLSECTGGDEWDIAVRKWSLSCNI